MRFAGFLALLTVLLIPSHSAAAVKFDVGLEFVRQFPAGYPRFLVVDDEEGLIYTTQWNGTVQVFDLEGKAVMTIEGRLADGTRVLKRPAGIALFKDRIFVADEGLSAISVFRRDGSFIESFGSSGTDPKEFIRPHGIRVEQGVVYVADMGNSRVQLLGPDGVFLGTIGDEGPEGDRLDSPTDIALAPNGDIYVADFNGRNVKCYGPDFALKYKAERVSFPFSLSLYDNGIIVSDPRNGMVTFHDFKGALLFGFGRQGTGPGMFENLMGIYLDKDLKLYLADQDAGNISIYQFSKIGPAAERVYPPPTSVEWVRDIDGSVGRLYWDHVSNVLYAVDRQSNAVLVLRDGEVQKKFTVDGWSPSGLAVGPDGALWVSDRQGDRLLKLGPDGKVLLKAGGPGGSDGKLKGPGDIAISRKGIVYVADTGNERVELFNTDGAFLRVLGKGGTSSYFKRPVALAVDPDGVLYVLDAKRREVLVFSPSGLPLNEFGKDKDNKLVFDEPVDIAINNEEVFVLDAGRRQVLVFDRKGNYVRSFGAPGSKKGDLKKPDSLAPIGMTRMLVSDPGNGRIQELRFVYTPAVLQGASARAGMREVSLEWRPAPEAYVEHYAVYRGASAKGPFSPAGETTGTTFTDSGLEPGETYYYRVTAAAIDGNESSGTPPVSATPEKYVPPAPMGLEADAGEDTVSLTWRKSGNPLVAGYVIQRRSLDGTIVKAGETDGTEFTDPGLPHNTSFTYLVSARSTDRLESAPAQVQTTTQAAGGSPLRIRVLELQDLLSNAYRLYEQKGMGSIRLMNTTRETIANMTVQFRVNEFMDTPAVLGPVTLEPGGSADLVLTPLFNDSIQDITENTISGVEITGAYSHGGRDLRLTVNRTVEVFEKHYTSWDEDGRIATFITAGDSVVGEFISSLAGEFPNTSDPLVLGGMLFDALGTVGTTYLPDKERPYETVSRQGGPVNRVQFPRETIVRGKGDNDDLVALYTALLENMGVPTRVLFTPGHMFMMFSIGFISETGWHDLDGKLVQFDGRAWVPVEVTLLGSSFLTAWEKGTGLYRRWEGEGLRMVDTRTAWGRFEPARPPADGQHPPLVIRGQLSQRFPADFLTLVRLGLRLKTAGYADTLKRDPNNVNAMLQTGILYAEAGEVADATRLFEKAAALDRTSAALQNNVANLRFLEERFEDACMIYEKAASLDQTDPLVLVNLARCLMRIEQYKKAEDAFRGAYELDKSISRVYRRMSLRLLGGF